MQKATTRMAIGALLAALGCATDDTKPFEYDEAAAARYAEAFCSCNPFGGPSQSCEVQVVGALSANGVQATRAGRIAVHAEHWEACLDEIADCRREAWPACEQFLVGQIEQGELCAFSNECADGLYCAAPENAFECALGVCAATHDRAEPCDGEDACTGDDVCFALADEPERTCRAPVERGEPCPIGDFGIEDHCAAGLRCVPKDDGAALCDEPLELGEPCGFSLVEGVGAVTVNGGIYPNACMRDAFCPEDTLECTPIAQQGLDDDERGQELGEPCENEFGEVRCDYGTVCEDNVCVELKSVGKACELDEECWGACVSGKCAPKFEQCSGE